MNYYSTIVAARPHFQSLKDSINQVDYMVGDLTANILFQFSTANVYDCYHDVGNHDEYARQSGRTHAHMHTLAHLFLASE